MVVTQHGVLMDRQCGQDKQALRVGLVAHYYPPCTLGGAEWSVAALAEALRKAGHDVWVLTPRFRGEPVRTEAGVWEYTYPGRWRDLAGPRSLWEHLPLVQRYITRCLMKGVRALGLQLLHAQHGQVLQPTERAAHTLGIPCVATLRDFSCIPADPGQWQQPEGASPGVWGYMRHMQRFQSQIEPEPGVGRRMHTMLDGAYRGMDVLARRTALRRYDGLVAVSSDLQQVYQAGGVGRSERFSVIPNPISTPPPHVNGERLRQLHGWSPTVPIVVGVGRMTLGKGADVFGESAGYIRHRYPAAQCVWVGGQGHWPPHHAIHQQLNRIGELSHAEAWEWIAAADVVVVPSRWREPWSRVILEAASLDRPIVATTVGGIPEMLQDGEDAWLVSPGNARALANGVLAVLKDSTEAARRGASAGHRLRQSCHPAGVARQWSDLYGGLVNSCEPSVSKKVVARRKPALIGDVT